MVLRRDAAGLALSVVLALGACAGRAGAGEPAGEPPTPPPPPAGVPSGDAPAGRARTDAPPTDVPATRDEIGWWSRAAGIAPELVLVTVVEGFALATQSVGVSGDDGMAAAWVRSGGAGTVLLRADRYPDPSALPCAELPDAAGPVLRCTLTRGDVHVVLEGEDVEAAVLRAAADAVRVPSAEELAHLFSDVRAAGATVERGDLPEHGEGAPLDAPGVGG